MADLFFAALFGFGCGILFAVSIGLAGRSRDARRRGGMIDLSRFRDDV